MKYFFAGGFFSAAPLVLLLVAMGNSLDQLWPLIIWFTISGVGLLFCLREKK